MDGRVRQREALTLGPAGQQNRRHTAGAPHADGVDIGRDELHRIIDRQPIADVAAGAVDIEPDVAIRVGVLEEQQLRDDRRRDFVIDRRTEQHHPLLEHAREEIPGALAPWCAFDDGRDRNRGHGAASLCAISSWVV